MYLGVCSFFKKYVLTLQCIHNAWKWTYIMVIGICHSRTSRTWQYLISNQVLDVLSTLTFYLIICTGMLLLLQKKFAAMHLEYTGYIKSYDVAYGTNIPYVTGILLANVVTVYWHMMAFLTQFNVFSIYSLYLETI